MYKYFIRPILFCFSPEAIHHFVASALRFAVAVPGGKWMMRKIYSYRHPSLERELFGIKFPNPIGMAAGFDKNGDIYRGVSTLGFGFVEVGTVTPLAQPGNPKPRLFRLKKDRALINRMGFNNRGLENMRRNMRRRDRGIIVGCNLGKNTATANENAAADYAKMFLSLYDDVDYFVINVSCPNVKDLTVMQSRDTLMPILNGLFDFRSKQEHHRPILLKISPDLTTPQIDEMIGILLETPLDGIIATNTTTSREGLQTPSNVVDKIANGGLSGAPLTERTIEVIRYMNEKTEGRYPIVGVGGVMTPEDAQRMLDAGASLVQIYTGFIYEGPMFVRRICKHLVKNSRQ